MSTLSERLMKVALLGVVPAEDQHVIADANAEIERLRAEVKQCSVELGEAAKLLRREYPRTAGIYDEACGRARITIGLTPCGDEQSAGGKDDA